MPGPLHGQAPLPSIKRDGYSQSAGRVLVLSLIMYYVSYFFAVYLNYTCLTFFYPFEINLSTPSPFPSLLFHFFTQKVSRESHVVPDNRAHPVSAPVSRRMVNQSPSGPNPTYTQQTHGRAPLMAAANAGVPNDRYTRPHPPGTTRATPVGATVTTPIQRPPPLRHQVIASPLVDAKVS